MFKLASTASVVILMAASLYAPALAADLPDGASRAELVNPAPAPMDAIIDGRVWHCQGAVCAAPANDGADVQTLAHECHRAALWLGQFTFYQTGSHVMSESELTACNARVTTKVPRSPG
jgi:hypothetical protein